VRVADASDGMDLVGLQDIGTVDQSIRPLWKDTDRLTYRILCRLQITSVRPPDAILKCRSSQKRAPTPFFSLASQSSKRPRKSLKRLVLRCVSKHLVRLRTAPGHDPS
jgi:hypothetical protein